MTHSIKNQQSALIVIDIQPAVLDILNNENQAKQVIENIKNLIDLARKKMMEIIFVRTAFTEEEFKSIPSHNKIFGSINSAAEMGLEESQESSQIHPKIDCLRQETDFILKKIRIGCFSSVKFQQRLEQKKISNLFICGIHTSKAILSIVYSSIDLDYKVIIISDACADLDSKTHNVLMDTLFPAVGEVIKTEKLKEYLEEDN